MACVRLHRKLSASFSRLLLLTLALGGVSKAVAQTVSFSSASTTLTSGFTDAVDGPQALALDKAGNVYVADTDGNQIVKIAPDGTRSILDVGSALNAPQGIAIDVAGNIYIADTDNSRVVEVPVAGAAFDFKTGGLSLGQPFGIAVDAAGNVYINDASNGHILKVTPNGSATLVNTGSYTVPYEAGLAVDQAGTLYIANTPQSQIIKVQGNTISLLNTGSQPLNAPRGISVDREGNVFVADTYTGNVVKVTPSGVAIVISTGNENNYYAPAIAATQNGVVYILETTRAKPSGQPLPDQVVVAQTQSASFGFANACKPGQATPSPCSRTLTLSYTSTSTEPITLNPSVALTQGIAAADFTLPSSATCEGIPPYGYYRCNQDVLFTPVVPGTHLGVFKLVDNDGNTIGTMPLSGTGRAPVAAFLPGTARILSTGDTGTSSPSGVTLSSPSAIVVDGAGTADWTDTANNRITQIFKNGSVTTLDTGGLTLSQPRGLAIDGAGTLYIADTGNNRIVKVTADNHASVLATGSLTLQQPYSIVTDSANNLYIADTGNSRIIKVDSDGNVSPLKTGNFTLGQPLALAIDLAGTLYISDVANHNIVEVAANGSATEADLGGMQLGYVSGLSVNLAGNLLLTDTQKGYTIELSRSIVPSLTFAPTPVGASSAAQTVTLINVGNAALTIPGLPTGNNPSISANFSLDNNSTCPRITSGDALSGELGVGISCTLNVSFVPTSMGTISGSLVITDDALNAINPHATQVIALNSSSNSELSRVTLGSSLNPSIYGQLVTFTASTSPTAAGGTITFFDGASPIGSSTIAANGHATFTTSTLTAGTHSITAQYAGNGTLLPATSAALAQLVTAASSTITWNPPAAISFGTNLSGVLNAKANTSGTFSYTAQPAGGLIAPVTSTTVLAAGKYTLTANFTPSDAVDYKAATQTASLTVTTVGPSPFFHLSLDKATLTLTPGQNGIVKAILTPENGFRGAVSLACSGLPELTTCSFSAKTLTANGSNTQQVSNVTVTAIPFSSFYSQLQPQPVSSNRPAPAGFWFLPAGLLGGWLFWQRKKFRATSKYLWMLVLLLSCTIGMMGCGVNFNQPGLGSATVTVTATADNGTSQTQTFTLTVVKQ